ncbi:MAG: hypothetical protein F6J92_40820 [Symploca sp. SIO1A3]|nr:hypothetical protein [Symploca sp. SIO1A3]
MNISQFGSDCQGTVALKQQILVPLNAQTPAAESVVIDSEELTEDEEFERHRLELKVERAFYEAGCALRELRDRRLYRSTHKTFEDYCRSRFRFTHRYVNYLIAGSQVVENLQMGTNGSQILPTSERQVRDLTELEAWEQCQIWEEAVEESGGKVPSGRIVKGIVQRLKLKGTKPPPLPYSIGDVVMIRGRGSADLKKFDGQWAIVVAVNEYTVSVALDKDRAVEPKFLEAIETELWTDIKAIHSRLIPLSQCELDPIDEAAFEILRRRTSFTPRQLQVLEQMERSYGVASSPNQDAIVPHSS